MIRLTVLLAVCYAGVTLILLSLQDRLLFHPVRASDRWIEPPPESDFRDVSLRSADGTAIHARWWPFPGARETVLLCHSRSGNLSLALTPDHVSKWRREIGASLFIFDYPGYGRSRGVPSEEGCYAAADAAYQWLIENRAIAPENLVIVGRSLGTAVAVDLASRKTHRALVLISPPSSLRAVAQSHYPYLPARWLVRNRFDSLAKIGQCAGPLVIVHGTHDRTAPIEQGKLLFAAAREPKRFVAVDGADHSDSVLAGFFPMLHAFLVEMTPPAERTE